MKGRLVAQSKYALALVNPPEVVERQRQLPQLEVAEEPFEQRTDEVKVEEPIRYIWRPKVYEPIAVTDRLREAAMTMLEPGEKAKAAVQRLAGQLRIDPRDARLVFDDLSANQRIFKRREEGTLFYDTEPVQRSREPVEDKVVKAKAAETLDKEQKAIAKRILRAMSGPMTYVTKPLTAQEISRMLQEAAPEEPVIDLDTIKNVTSVLQKQGLVVKPMAREGRKRGRAKRLEVQKIGIANQQIMKALKSPEQRNTILRLVDSGDAFIAADE